MDDPFKIDSTKISLHPQRVAQWLDAGDDWSKLAKVYPLYIEISPMGACNHRCTFCGVDYIGYNDVKLDPFVLEKTLHSMAANGVKSVMFAGEGEPLLYKPLAECILYAKSVGIDVAITTNAVALTEKFSKCLGAVTWLKASVNAGTEATYAAVHRTKPMDFHRVWDNLARAVELRAKHAWKTTLGAQMVMLPENIHEAFDLCDLAKVTGLDYVVLKPYSQHLKSTETAGKGYDRTDFIDEDKLAKVLATFTSDKFKVIYRSLTLANLHEQTRGYTSCHSTPFFWAYLMATGDLYGCSAYLLDERFRYGNVNEQSFAAIWEGERRRASVEHVRRELDISECRKSCRMDMANRFLDSVVNPGAHVNFI